MEIGYECILGGLTASILVLVFVLHSSTSEKKTKASIHEESDSGVIRTLDNGKKHQEISDTTDIIIVGAGVAGAALAYTLGKVVKKKKKPLMT